MKNLFYLLLITIVAAGCDNDDNKATLSVKLTDSPANYQEVLIDVQDVMVNISSQGDENGWITLEGTNAGVYNLLDFTNGVDTLLVEQELAAGKISQMRLILGDDNQLKVDGEYHDLTVPSSQQSGLKFNIHADLVEGVTYKMWIDFDAGRSIIAKGNGTYALKPVIRTFTEATSGSIKGVVSPVEAKPYIIAVSASSDTIGTYADTTTGYFLLRGVSEGSVDLTFNPIDGFENKYLNDVVVELGVATDVDTVLFE